MSKWRVPQIVRQASGFDCIGINAADIIAKRGLDLAKFLSQTTPDLRHLQGMRETVMEYVPVLRRRDLSDFSKATERRGVEDPISIPLRGGAIFFYCRGLWRSMSAAIARMIWVAIINQ